MLQYLDPIVDRITSLQNDTHDLNVEAIRRHFVFPKNGRIVTNNAASTQPPKEQPQLSLLR